MYYKTSSWKYCDLEEDKDFLGTKKYKAYEKNYLLHLIKTRNICSSKDTTKKRKGKS